MSWQWANVDPTATRRGTPVCLGKHHRCGSGPCPKLGIKIRNFPAILVAWKDKSKRKQVSQQKKGRKMIGSGGFLPIFLGDISTFAMLLLVCFVFYREFLRMDDSEGVLLPCLGFWIFFLSGLVESVMNLSIWALQMPFDPLDAWKKRFEPYLTTRYRFGPNIFGLFLFGSRCVWFRESV